MILKVGEIKKRKEKIIQKGKKNVENTFKKQVSTEGNTKNQQRNSKIPLAHWAATSNSPRWIKGKKSSSSRYENGTPWNRSRTESEVQRIEAGDYSGAK